MRISKPAIEAVKRRHELSAFVASSGVELKKEGAHLVGRCPFHDDRQASLVVNPKKQLWNCLGGCRANPDAGGGRGSSGGDLFAYAMKLWGVGFREAFERLGGVATPEVAPAPRRPAGDRQREEPIRLESRAPRTELFGRVIGHYQKELAQNREAQAYLESRGLRNRRLWRRFKLGYAAGTLPELVGEEETSEVRELLVDTGILTARGAERMAGRIVFPLVAFNRLPVFLYGRSIDDGTEPHHLYLPGSCRGLFNWESARHAEEVIVVESVIDALSLVEAGVTPVVPLFGAHGVIDEHRELVERFGTKRLVVALDADETGKKAAETVAATFAELGLEVRTIEWPGHDPNELLVAVGPQRLREITKGLLRPPRATSSTASSAAGGGSPPPDSSSLIAFPPDRGPSPAEDEKAVREEETRQEKTRQEKTTPSREELVADSLVLVWGRRRWRIVWAKASSPTKLRATVRLELGLSASGDGPAPPVPAFLDSLDLYAARARASFAKRAVAAAQVARERAGQALADDETASLAAVVEADLVAIAELGERRREAKTERRAAVVAPSPAARARALALLKASDLLSRVARDLSTVGYVGEDVNKTIGYLVGISRKLPSPLSMVILSPSGSGKSGLADAIEALTPPEELFSLSSLTPQALYYMPPGKLRRKLLLIEERVGSAEADYSIRALQSKKRLTRAVPIKDPSTGKIETKVFAIEGPAAFIETTTESRIHIENATRCFEIHLDESEEQTRRIHEAQRRAKGFAGLVLSEERGRVVAAHYDAQRLLRPVPVVIPYAEHLEFPASWLRTRRDHLRFLHLIEAVAFLHQYQRPLVHRETKEPMGIALEELSEALLAQAVVVATVADYRAAHHLALGLLGDSLLDLKRPERAFLESVRRHLAEKAGVDEPDAGDVVFSRREIREATGLPQHRVRQLFELLAELEYLEPVGASRGARVRYRLTPAASAEEQVVPGLLTPEELEAKLAALEARDGAVAAR